VPAAPVLPLPVCDDFALAVSVGGTASEAVLAGLVEGVTVGFAIVDERELDCDEILVFEEDTPGEEKAEVCSGEKGLTVELGVVAAVTEVGVVVFVLD
jgi:hypothetical protein